MKSATAPSAIGGDDRGRQTKALRRWEEQQAVWERVQSNLAKQVRRDDPAETLPGSIHHQRLRNEELGILDVAVPASVRNGSNAWEMSLRGGGGGVRYVQIGKAYPYPLYCPIRDSDQVKEDSEALMRLIPMSKVPPRNKPASETQYFHERQAQFRKYIKKKFAHFQHQEEPLVIEGSKVPTSADPIPESDLDPVLFVPYQGGAGNNAHPTPQFVTDEPKSRPLSAVVTPPQTTSSTLPQRGPMLCFSTAHVQFTAAPGEAVQGTVTVENIGTTAVYYSWAVVAQTSIVEEKTPDFFSLSHTTGGVMLPEEQQIFTFTVRSPIAGVFVKQYEFLTVPAGKERIVVHLRAVVTANELNDVGTSRIDKELSRKAIRDFQRQLITDPIWNQSNLVLDRANIEIELRSLSLAKAKKLAEMEGVGELQEAAWLDANASLGIPYNQVVFSRLVTLHRCFQTFLSQIDEAAASAAAQRSVPYQRVPPLKDWDGSVRSMFEDLALLKDNQCRNTFVSAAQTLLKCAKVSQDRSENLHTLISRAAGRVAWSQAAEDFHLYSSIARDLSEGKASKAKIEKVDPKAAKAPPPKPAKAPPAKGAAVPTGGATTEAPKDGAVPQDSKHPNYDKFYFAGARRIVGDAVEAIFGESEAMAETVAVVTDRPFECVAKNRMEEIIQVQLTPDPDIDLVPESSKQKKK